MRKALHFLAWGWLSICAVLAQPASLLPASGENRWVEKLYLRTDRPNYLAGETIRFRIFYLDGFKHEAANLSKVAYVELISEAKSPVIQAKVKLDKAGGVGQLTLPYTIGTGTYQLRAYTRWMRNESERLFFHQSVSIINPMEALPATGKLAVVPRFYPEGGHFVAGLENRVGIFIPQGANVAGVIQNQQREVVAQFSTSFDGRASFTFTPRENERYAAVFSMANQAYHTPLPNCDAGGVQLRAMRTDKDLQIQLLSTAAHPHQLYVLLHQTRMKSKRLMVSMENGKGIARYPWLALPAGITHVTIFDDQLHLLAERLVFKTPATPLPIAVSMPAQTSQRTKVSVSVASADTLKTGDVAISVYRLDSLSFRRSSLQSYLWLESELGEEIAHGDRYLEASDSAWQAADLLMLTMGWSRYSEQSIQNEFAPELHGPLTDGIATDETGLPMAGLSLLASARGQAQIYTTLSDRAGKFTFELPDLNGPTSLFVQNWTDPTQTMRGQWISPFDTRVSFSPARGSLVEASNDLQRAFIHQQVEAAFREPDATSVSASTKPQMPFYGQANESYRLDDYTRFPTLEEVFREYIKGVWVRKNKNGLYFLQLNRLNQSLMEGSNLVLLNGQPVTNVNKLMEFDPLKVERIDVVDRKFFAGPITFQGIVNVITTPEEANAGIPDEKTLELAYEGYQVYRERPARWYADDQARQSRAPDFRHQLYWNPKLTISGKGNGLEFFTSDVTGSFIMLIEGVAPDGQCMAGSAVFNVVR